MQKEKERADKPNAQPNPYIEGFKQSVPEGVGYGITFFFLIHYTKKLASYYTYRSPSEKDNSSTDTRSNLKPRSKL